MLTDVRFTPSGVTHPIQLPKAYEINAEDLWLWLVSRDGNEVLPPLLPPLSLPDLSA